jgi:DNA-binding transcriptional LysR family regulator
MSSASPAIKTTHEKQLMLLAHLLPDAEPISQFGQFRGKRLAIGMPGTALRSLILQVLKSTDALDASTQLLDVDYSEALDALIAGKADVAVFPSQLDGPLLQRALGAPGIGLMNVAHSEAIAKKVPGLRNHCPACWPKDREIDFTNELPQHPTRKLYKQTASALPRSGPKKR